MPGKKPLKYSQQQLSDLLNGVYADKINAHKLPEDLYFATANYLKDALIKGFYKEVGSYAMTKVDKELLAELRENIYMFSAAKTYQQVRVMSDAVADEDGAKRPFKEFKEDADSIFQTYNENYLRAEQDTAYASGQMGAKWNGIESQKSILPYLRISVVEDANTSDICEPLDGITLPVDDEFWDDYYPPNHFNCRSTVEQLDEADISSPSQVDDATEHADEHMSDEFKMNVGKDKIVFSDDHPYFDVEKGDKEYAKKNFDLPIPNQKDNDE